LFSLLLCVTIVAIGLLYWYSEQLSEQKLQFYIRRLENMDITVEEQPLQGFSEDEISTFIFWNDFSMEIEILQVDHVYNDRGRHLLYFIYPKGDGLEAEAFNYKWNISDLFS